MVLFRKKGKQTSKKTKYQRCLLFLALLGAAIVLIGNTYAWLTAEDQVTNHFEGTTLQAEIVETFTPNQRWDAATTTPKVICVRNIGAVPALIRVSLYEYLLTFKIDVTDQTGNGNLKQAAQPVAPRVDEQNVRTWQNAAAAGGTYTVNGAHFIADQAIIAQQTNGAGRYQQQDPERAASALKWLQLNFPQTVYTRPPGPEVANYGLYDNGYFYYSELVAPGTETTPVLTSVTLSASTPNKYKGMLYQLTLVMDAHDATETLVDTWGLTADSAVYQMYAKYLQK